MPVYVTYLFYGAVFLSVLLLMRECSTWLSRPGSAASSPNRRLRMLVGSGKREEVMERLAARAPVAERRSRAQPGWNRLPVAGRAIRRAELGRRESPIIMMRACRSRCSGSDGGSPGPGLLPALERPSSWCC